LWCIGQLYLVNQFDEVASNVYLENEDNESFLLPNDFTVSNDSTNNKFLYSKLLDPTVNWNLKINKNYNDLDLNDYKLLIEVKSQENSVTSFSQYIEESLMISSEVPVIDVAPDLTDLNIVGMNNILDEGSVTNNVYFSSTTLNYDSSNPYVLEIASIYNLKRQVLNTSITSQKDTVLSNSYDSTKDIRTIVLHRTFLNTGDIPTSADDFKIRFSRNTTTAFDQLDNPVFNTNIEVYAGGFNAEESYFTLNDITDPSLQIKELVISYNDLINHYLVNGSNHFYITNLISGKIYGNLGSTNGTTTNNSGFISYSEPGEKIKIVFQ
jgi:hypothetical protein